MRHKKHMAISCARAIIFSTLTGLEDKKNLKHLIFFFFYNLTIKFQKKNLPRWNQ